MPILSKNKNESSPNGASPRANNANGVSVYKEGDWTPFFKYLPEELTTYDVLVYGQIRMRMNYQDGKSTASAKTIAKETRMSQASVWKSIDRLTGWNMIARTKSGKKNGSASHFVALDIDQWKLKLIRRAAQDEEGSLPDEEGVSTTEAPGLYQVDTGSLLHRHQVSTTWTQEEVREQPFINESEEELAQSRTKEVEFDSEEDEAVHTAGFSTFPVPNKKEGERGLYQVDTPSLQDEGSDEDGNPEEDKVWPTDGAGSSPADIGTTFRSESHSTEDWKQQAKDSKDLIYMYEELNHPDRPNYDSAEAYNLAVAEWEIKNAEWLDAHPRMRSKSLDVTALVSAAKEAEEIS